MPLWVDKYRPQTLEKLDLHDDITAMLQRLLASSDFPHLLIYGPSGSGKSTRVGAILHNLFGRSVLHVRVQPKTIKLKSKTLEISLRQSHYHIELNAADAGINDRHVIQEVIKELAETTNVAAAVTANNEKHDLAQSALPFGQTTSSSSSSSLSAPAASSKDGARAFKVVVLTEVDRLSLGAQQALRRTMEKYTATCRLILVSESLSRIIPPIRSRCLPIRIAAPSIQQISHILRAIGDREGLTVDDAFATNIAEQSGRNLRRALLILEVCKVKHPSTTQMSDSTVTIRRSDWELFIDHICKLIIEQQSPERLLLVRTKLYELLTNCIPPDIIMSALVDGCMRRVDDMVKHEVVQAAALYSHRMAIGSKPIFHLEAFVAKFMAIYKRWAVEFFNVV